MAITRTQIAKQLLAQGGRTGFQGGGKDLGTKAGDTRAARDEGAIGERMQSIGATPTPKEDGGPPVEYIGGEIVPVTVDNRAEREKLRKEQRDKIQDRLKKFKRLDSKQRKFQKFISKFSPVATFASKFGPLNTRDFFLENVLQSKNPLYSGISQKDFSELTEKQQEDFFQDYLKGRLSGETDAYGNKIMRDNDGPDPIPFISKPIEEPVEKIEGYINPLSLLTPRIAGTRFLGTEFEEEDDTEFAANGGRIGFGGGSDMGQVADSKGNVGPGKGGYQGKGDGKGGKAGGPGDRPDDRSTFEQTVNQRKVINKAKKQKPSNLEKLYRTGSEFNFLKNLATGNFPALGKQLLFDLSKKKFLDNQAMLDTEDDDMMLADVSASDINRLLGTNPYGKQKYSPDQDVSTIRDIEGDFLNPTITDEEIEGVLKGTITEPTGQFAADGGRIGAMNGGIMNVEDLDREAFLLGGIAKGLKKATRAVKKIAKSPIGKAALIAGGGYLLGGGIIPGVSGRFIPFAKYGSSAGSGFGFGNILPNILNIARMPGLAEKAFSMGTTGKALTGILGASLLSGLTTKKEDDGFNINDYYAQNTLDPNAPLNKRIAGSEFDFYGGVKAADGGRIGYQEGGDAEPVAKKTMPLIDMDGKEKDYRETGGFVEMGRMEKADDVPARLSKNEFVFTADAVRNAGEGDIDKGAEVMYNMMKNLEAGGEVSEESQGLEGAREMFQTSQRLGEVI